MLDLLDPATGKPVDDDCQPKRIDTVMSLIQCLERPDFFRGQHLTDDDLDAVIRWTRGRLRLSRLREGWGVVCGLHVSVDAANTLLCVSPGYAVDACGEDIIACKELKLNFRDLCPPRCQKDATDATASDKQDDAKLEDRLENWMSNIKSKGTEFDLTIHFDEQPTNPRLASRRGCTPNSNGSCHHARMLEGACLRLRPAASDGPQVNADRADSLALQMKLLAEELNKLIESAIEQGKEDPAEHGEVVRRRLLAWIDKSPPSPQPVIRELVRTLPAKQLAEQQSRTIILKKLAEDAVSRSDLEQCAKCNPAAGVHLAKVCLLRIDTRPCCVVTKIDQSRTPFECGHQHDQPVLDLSMPIEELKIFSNVGPKTLKFLVEKGFRYVSDLVSISDDDLEDLLKQANSMGPGISGALAFLRSLVGVNFTGAGA